MKKHLEIDAKDSFVKDIPWEVDSLQTESVQIKDPGVGEAVVLRSFFFKMAPIPKGIKRMNKSQVIAGYKKMIDTMLWSDGLRPVQEKSPVMYYKHELRTKQYSSLLTKMIEEGADAVIMVGATSKETILDKIHIAK